MGTRGSPGTWETLSFPQQRPEVGRLVHQTPGPWEAALGPTGASKRAHSGTVAPGELKCGGKGGRESECRVVPRKRGNRPGGTPWREGGTESRSFWWER